jgi:D-alanyl-D-alanine carboxypeptidase
VKSDRDPVNYHCRSRFLFIAVATLALSLSSTSRAQAEAKLLLEASTGKVLLAENATYPWYPASVTKLMTTYTTLREVQQRKITLNTLITMTHDGVAQEPSKMGLPVGTRLTIDNALKMLLVKSANDVAVAIAEGVGGSIPKFADLMNANAARLGMTQSHFVNPNGLPAEHHVTSARDLGILARALIREFPQYDYYWHIHSIRFGNRIIHNYNRLLDRYPGADGMKTGFICASGFNLVASATRNGRRLIAVVLGAYSGNARNLEAAKLLERGFDSTPLSWLTPSLGTVDALAPIDAPPPDLRDEMCGPHRHRSKPPSDNDDDNDVVASAGGDNGSGPGFMLSALGPTNGKFVLGPPTDTEPPVVVFTGPADHPDPAPVVHHHRAKKKTVHHHGKAAKRTSHRKPKAKSAQK